MATYATIQAKIDKGLGIAGSHLGPPYNAFRLEATSAGDFPGGWTLVQPNLPLYKERVALTNLDVTLKDTIAVFYNIFASMKNFFLGDVFVLNDPAFTPGISYGAGATSIPGTIEFQGIALAAHFPASCSDWGEN